MLEIFLSGLIVWAAFWEVGMATLLKSHQSLGFLMTSIWGKFLHFLYSQIEMIYMVSLTLYVKHFSSERRNHSFKVTKPKGQEQDCLIPTVVVKVRVAHAHHSPYDNTRLDMNANWLGREAAQVSRQNASFALLLLKALVWPWQATDHAW